MPRPRTGGLSADAYGLVLVVDELAGEVPAQVHKIARAVDKALLDRQPRSRLNRSVAALQRHDRNSIPALRDWLSTSETHEDFRRLGLITSWTVWTNAAERMSHGSRAASALHAPFGGRPRNLAFPAAHDVALLATYLQKTGRFNRNKALIEAETIVQRSKPSLAESINPRAIARWLKVVRGTSLDDLEVQAKAIMATLQR